MDSMSGIKGVNVDFKVFDVRSQKFGVFIN